MRDVQYLPTAEGYDRWSDFYDTEGNPLLDLDESVVRELLPDPRGLRVLDLGCGTGRHLGRFLDAGARVVGLDFSAGMLAQARRKHGHRPDLTLLEADASGDLPLEQGSFDLVFSSLVLEHVAGVAGFFRQAAGLCRPGGTLLLTTMHPALFLRDVQAHYVDRESGREFRFESHPHQVGAFILAALGAGLALRDIREAAPGRELAAANPRLEKFLGWPMLLALLLERPRIAA